MRAYLFVTVFLVNCLNAFAGLTQPKLYIPNDKATDQPTSAHLYINNGTSSYEYEFQLSENSSFSNPQIIKEKQSSGSLVSVRFNKLKFGQTYYWRVKVRSDKDSSSWTSARSFTTTSKLQLYSPSTNGRTYGGSKTYFSWYRAHPYDSFVSQLDTSPNFNSNALIEYQTKDTFSTFYGEQIITDLYYGTKYYYRLKGYGNGDSSGWTDVLWGQVLDTLSNAKVDKGSIKTDLDVEFQWSSIGEGYQFQLDTSSDFNSPMLVDTMNVDGSKNYPQLRFNELRYDQRYYWRLRARNRVDTSSWVTYSFITDNIYTDKPSVNYPYIPTYKINVPTVNGSTGHRIQLDTTPTFDSKHLVTLDSSGQTFEFYDLSFGQTYFVRSLAYHASDTSKWSKTNSFTVVNYVSLYYPRLGDTMVNIRDSFTWGTLFKGVTHYQFQLSKNPNFDNVLVDSIMSESSASFKSGRLGGVVKEFKTKYYWRVRMWHSKDTSDWTYANNLRHFSTVGPPDLVKPYNSDLLKANASLDLTWKPHTGVNCYQVLLSTSGSFADTIFTAYSS